jgi:hypothetical protein
MGSVGIVYSGGVIGVGSMRSGFGGSPGADGVGIVYSFWLASFGMEHSYSSLTGW